VAATLSGLYTLPLDFNISTSLFAREGYPVPYYRQITTEANVPSYASTKQYLLGNVSTSGSPRSSSGTGLSKVVKVGPLDVTLMADCFNLLNRTRSCSARIVFVIDDDTELLDNNILEQQSRESSASAPASASRSRRGTRNRPVPNPLRAGSDARSASGHFGPRAPRPGVFLLKIPPAPENLRACVEGTSGRLARGARGDSVPSRCRRLRKGAGRPGRRRSTFGARRPRLDRHASGRITFRVRLHGGRDSVLGAFRKEAILFERAYSHVPLTLPSHASIFTGTLPAVHGLRDNLGYTLNRKVRRWRASEEERIRDGRRHLERRPQRRERHRRGFDFYEDTVEPTEAIRLSAGSSAPAPRRRPSSRDGWRRSLRRDPSSPSSTSTSAHALRAPEPYASRYRKQPYDGEIAWADELTGASSTS